MKTGNTAAVITGGASGLGLAVAKRLLADGAQVCLLDLNESAGVAAISELGDGAVFLKLDVSNEMQMRDALDQCMAVMGKINVAVSCAGILGPGRALGREGTLPLDTFAQTVNVNLTGSFNLAKFAAERMEQNQVDDGEERGVIVNTASIAAYEGQIGQAAYAASKAGIIGMTLPLAREFSRIGVRVMSIAPGVFHTPMIAAMPPERQAALGATIPFPQRLGEPEEFANLVVHCIENTYLNGSTIRLDGASRLAAK